MRVYGMGEAMFTFDPALYVSSDLKEKKMRICESFMKGKIVEDIYVIYRSPAGSAEFVQSRQLKQKYYRDRDMHILGFTRDYDKALLYLAYYAAERVGA
ncbi:MAG: hypothetical protein J6X66_13145 [Lachnospiraceae bacterium]|nr:hypothetical protein [Lachnospiraceae bacterium]